MTEINFIELLGYLGSIIVAISLTMTSMIKLRWYNLIGSIIFTIYGFIINAIPVAAVNMLIIGVNIVFMIKLYNTKDYFKVLEIGRNSEYLNSFLGFYEDLIHKDFPHIKTSSKDKGLTLLILRNMAVVGVLMGKKLDTNTMEIEMDFVIPQYRDYKPGEFVLVKNLEYFKKKGFIICWRILLSISMTAIIEKWGLKKKLGITNVIISRNFIKSEDQKVKLSLPIQPVDLFTSPSIEMTPNKKSPPNKGKASH